jgi:hypothetical protein
MIYLYSKIGLPKALNFKIFLATWKSLLAYFTLSKNVLG